MLWKYACALYIITKIYICPFILTWKMIQFLEWLFDPEFQITNWFVSAVYYWNENDASERLLFIRSKGRDSLYNSPQRNAPLSLPCVLSNTAYLPVQWKHTKPAQLKGGMDTETVPASKTKSKCAGNTPNTLILANRLRSNDRCERLLPKNLINTTNIIISRFIVI